MAPLIWIWLLLCWSTGGSFHLHCCSARLLGLLGPWLRIWRPEEQNFLPMGKGPKQSREDVCVTSLPPSAPTLAFVNKWCGLCCEGVFVFVLRGRRLAEEDLVLEGFHKAGLGDCEVGFSYHWC